MNKLIPGYRGIVNAWECDQMGHMNVQFYAGRCAEAFGHFQNALGLSPQRIRETNAGLRLKSIRMQFKSELHAGAAMHGFAGVRSIEGDLIHGFFHMFDSAYYKLSAVFEFTARHVDYISGEQLDLPREIRARAEDLADEHENMYRPAPFAGSLMPHAKLDHMVDTGLGSVDVWECDAFGQLELRHVVNYFSGAVTHILGNIGLTREVIRERNLGSAALDYWSEFHAPIPKSAPLKVRSGLMGASGKIFQFGHSLTNVDLDEIAVTTTVLGCYFDMTSRKSVPLPEEFTNYPKERLLVPA